MKLRSGVEARVWACGCGGCARVGCICLRVQSPFGVSITCMRVCVRACVATSCGFGPFVPTSAHCRAAGAAARAWGARQGHLLHEGEGAPRVARPVQALGGTVRPAPAAAAADARSRRCRRCAAARGAAAPGRWGRTPRRWMRRRRRCRSSATAEPRARTAGACGRPARVKGWARAARRGRTVGAQVRGRHRARGAAGGGRLAEPQDSVSAAAAALTPAPPMRRRGVGRVVSARAPDVHDWVHVCVHMCVRGSACACMRTYARMRRMRSSVRVGVCVHACAR